jgi:hypothetical protein
MLLCICAPLAITADESGNVTVQLVPDKSNFMLSERVYLSFVVENLTDREFHVLEGGNYRNQLGRPEDFQVIVTDTDGNAIEKPDAGPSFGGMIFWREIEPRKTHKLKLFLPNWADITKPGAYTIKATTDLCIHRGPEEPGFDKFPPGQTKTATAQITVLPDDDAAIGKYIDQLGAQMISGAKSYEASRALSSMNDERVIPWFVKEFERPTPVAKIRAVRALQQYNHPDAFNVLKAAMRTHTKSDKEVKDEDLWLEEDSHLRHSAAVALSASPHPAAPAFLLAQRNDPYYAVRLTVLHAIAKLPDNRARPLLQEMTTDCNEMVANEAKRYLKRLEKQPTPR